MSTPPFVLACTLTYFLGPLSDRLRTRGPLISFVSLLGVTGFSILYATTSPEVGYIGCFIACCGIYPNTALLISWAGSNTQEDLKRAVVLAIASGFGNVGGYVCFVFVPALNSIHMYCVGFPRHLFSDSRMLPVITPAMLPVLGVCHLGASLGGFAQ